MSTTDRYPPRASVHVDFPGDPRDGDEGTVLWSYADCDDMIHVVAFADGTRGHYAAAELLGHGLLPPPRPAKRPPSPPRPLVRSGAGTARTPGSTAAGTTDLDAQEES